MIRARSVYRCMVLIICLGFTSGCWDREEMDDLALVMATGLDLANDGQLEVTLQIALPTGIPSSLKSGGKGNKPVLVVSAKGRTGMDIVSKLQVQLSRRIYLGHRGVIVFGEKYSRHGIDQVLDTFIRFPDARYNSYAVTSYGTTAKEILNTPYQLEQIPAVGIKNIQLNNASLSVKIDEFLDAVASNGKSPVTGGITVINKGTDQQTFTIDKAAVYQGNKLVGFLSRQELNLFRLWTGDIAGLTITTQMKPKEKEYKGTISIEVLNVKTNVRTTIKNQIPEVSLIFKVSARVVENDTRLDVSKVNNLHRVEAKFSNDTHKLLTSMISRVQKKFKADIFGLGDEIHIEHPYVWKKMKDQWKDIYPKAPVIVKVDFNIETTGRTQAPAHLKK